MTDPNLKPPQYYQSQPVAPSVQFSTQPSYLGQPQYSSQPGYLPPGYQPAAYGQQPMGNPYPSSNPYPSNNPYPVYPQQPGIPQQAAFYPPPISPESEERLLGNVKEQLLMKGFHYDVHIGKWLHESWDFFKHHWIVFVIFTAVYLGVANIPYVGVLISFGMTPGYFIVASHAYRPGFSHEFRVWTMLHGYLLYLPLLWIGILYSLAISIGLFLCIIPGLYLMVAFSFTSFLWIEYRQQGLGIIDAFSVSRQVMTREFWGITLLILAQVGLVLLGCLMLLVGVLVTIPLANLMAAFAFRDIFGFSEKRHIDHGLVCGA